MTPDDKRRLAEIRNFVSAADTQTDRVFLLRLLDEAIAERDAAMAALRDCHIAYETGDEDDCVVACSKASEWFAAHSAATKPTEEVPG